MTSPEHIARTTRRATQTRTHACALVPAAMRLMIDLDTWTERVPHLIATAVLEQVTKELSQLPTFLRLGIEMVEVAMCSGPACKPNLRLVLAHMSPPANM